MEMQAIRKAEKYFRFNKLQAEHLYQWFRMLGNLSALTKNELVGWLTDSLGFSDENI
jgi:hypothetical protein